MSGAYRLSPLAVLAATLLPLTPAFAVCGDGLPDGGETCDDGNLVVGDGCGATCQTEPGFSCAAPEGFIAAPGSNLGFEQPDGALHDAADRTPGNFLAENVASLTDWNHLAGPVDLLIAGGAFGTPPEGVQAVNLTASPNAATITQDLDTVPGGRYRVSFRLAEIGSVCGGAALANVYVSAEGRDGQGALIQTFGYRFTQVPTTSANWSTQSLDFTAVNVATSFLMADVTGDAYCGAVVDDVRLRRMSTCAEIDTDNDGLPDNDEDLNGDGILDPGESDPNDPDTDDDGLTDFEEVTGSAAGGMYSPTDPNNPDSDGDGLWDGQELGRNAPAVGTDPAMFRADADTTTTTDPNDADSDDDGLQDSSEDANVNGRRDAGETDPNNADSDGDGLQDGTEIGLFVAEVPADTAGTFRPDLDPLTITDPLDPDSDNGGVLDGAEDRNGNGRIDPTETDPNNTQDDDEDGDGIITAEELVLGTDPQDADSDDDGLTDNVEITGTGRLQPYGATDPLNADTDGDGLQDGTEVGLLTVGPDTDLGVFISDVDPATRSNPLDDDVDDDGLLDGTEDANHDGRRTAGETDPFDADSDNDGLLDGLEAGAGAPEGENTNLAVFRADQDPSTTTDPLNPDTDGGGIPDGIEDADHNGLRSFGEADPNDPSDDDADGDGISNQDETALGTDPNNPDTDGDGLNDGAELVRTTDPLNPDTDNDGLNDGDEITAGTDPLDPDTDNDTLLDGDEVTRGTDPRRPDTDGDGLRDDDEVTRGTDPTRPDTDGDGLNDRAEVQRGTDPLNPDTDGDLLRDGLEVDTNTDPRDSDTDNDGLTDGAEDINRNGVVDAGETDPRNPDTDGDGLNDGDEIAIGTDPLDPDTDDDGINDGDEVDNGTDPGSADGDGDGLTDTQEAIAGTDPNDADSDDDGLSDADEWRGTGPLAAFGATDPTNPDTDGDGVLDGTEVGVTAGGPDTGATFLPDLDPTTTTDPLDADTDDDGLLDGTEDADADGRQGPGEPDPSLFDSDNDGLSDGVELGLAAPETADTDLSAFLADADPSTTTDPTRPDTDGGGVADGAEDSNSNGQVDFAETDPLDPSDDLLGPDSDGDGLPNGLEDRNGNGEVDLNETDPLDPDSDDDGLLDGDEVNGTGPLDGYGPSDPISPDTDGDGIPDGREAGVTTPTSGTDGTFVADADPSTTTNPNEADTDGDGLDDGEEDLNANGRIDDGETDPNEGDGDGDGLNDGAEVAGGTDPFDPDSDDDGLFDGREDANGNGAVDAGETDPRTPDTDNDGVTDGVETGATNADVPGPGFVADADPATTTDPGNPDTDGDGRTDGEEDANGNGRVDEGETDPNNPDTDGDGLTDGEEVEAGTDPLNPDTDGDGFEDGFEVDNGTDPLSGMRLQGSPGCDHSRPGATGILGLLALGLLRRRRAVAFAAVLPSVALAQDEKPRLDAQRFDPIPQLRGFTLVRNDVIARRGSFGGRLGVNYGLRPLELGGEDGQREVGLIDHLIGLDVALAGSPTDWLSVGVNLPVAQIALGSAQGDAYLQALGGSGGTAGIGDLTLELAFQPLRQRANGPISLGIIPRAIFPTGSRDMLVGSGSASVGADVAVGGSWDFFRFGVHAGYQWQAKSAAVSTIVADDEVRFGAGLAVPLAKAAWEIQLEYAGSAIVTGAARDATPAAGTLLPMEILLGAQYRAPWSPVWASFGVGRGLTSGFGEPEIRAFATLGFVIEKDRPGAPVPSMDRSDNDHDGIIAAEDACPDQAEDFNGVDDIDGCPDGDSDFDSVPDAQDRCPNQREDLDLFQDDDGCPELDNDQDGIPDIDDACPNDPEIVNGLDDADGCPDDRFAMVDLVRGEISITQAVYFDTGTAVIQSQSFPVLDAVARLMTAYSVIEEVEVQGHTDTRGNADENLTLSQSRADAVRDYLIRKGVAAERLVSKGYGQTQPVVADARTDTDHAKNRRVVFSIRSK